MAAPNPISVDARSELVYTDPDEYKPLTDQERGAHARVLPLSQFQGTSWPPAP